MGNSSLVVVDILRSDFNDDKVLLALFEIGAVINL